MTFLTTYSCIVSSEPSAFSPPCMSSSYSRRHVASLWKKLTMFSTIKVSGPSRRKRSLVVLWLILNKRRRISRPGGSISIMSRPASLQLYNRFIDLEPSKLRILQPGFDNNRSFFMEHFEVLVKLSLYLSQSMTDERNLPVLTMYHRIQKRYKIKYKGLITSK